MEDVMKNIEYKNYKKAKAIIFSDYSEYEEGKSNNGGCYGYTTVFEKVPNKDIWYKKEYTTGEFCPYCRSFFCSGDCEQAEYEESQSYTNRDILHQLHGGIELDEEISFVY